MPLKKQEDEALPVFGDSDEPIYEDVEIETAEEIAFDDGDVAKAMELQATLPEAGASVFVKLFGRSGGEASLTVRGPHIKYVLDHLDQGLRALHAKYGLSPVVEGEGAGRTYSKKIPENAIRTPDQYDEYGNPVLESGTGVINKIMVNPEGKIEFSVGRFTYPFGDTRGAKKVAALFDSNTGFDESALSKPVLYTPKDWGDPLYADWIKIQKTDKNGKSANYYNVIRVHL